MLACHDHTPVQAGGSLIVLFPRFVCPEPIAAEHSGNPVPSDSDSRFELLIVLGMYPGTELHCMPYPFFRRHGGELIRIRPPAVATEQNALAAALIVG